MNKLFFLSLYACFIFANTGIYVEVNQDTIYIGDKIQVTLTAQNHGMREIEFPQLDVDNKDISLSTIFSDDTSLVFSIHFWRTGIHKFPSIKVQISNEDGNSDVIKTDPIDFTVLERIEELENNLRGSKINKKLHLPLTINHLILSFVILISLIVVYIILTKKQKLDSSKYALKQIDCFNDALIDLDQLILPKEIDKNEIELFYISLTNILKNYLGTKFFFNATKMTTDEIIHFLISHNIRSSGLKNLLEEADLCKFSQNKYGPTRMLEAKKNARLILSDFECGTI